MAKKEKAKIKAITTSELMHAIAAQTGHPKKVVSEILTGLAALAYDEAGHGFKIPGIGKLVVVDRAARTGRNPKTGETIQIPAKRALKFRIAKVCKDAVLNG